MKIMKMIVVCAGAGGIRNGKVFLPRSLPSHSHALPCSPGSREPVLDFSPEF